MAAICRQLIKKAAVGAIVAASDALLIFAWPTASVFRCAVSCRRIAGYAMALTVNLSVRSDLEMTNVTKKYDLQRQLEQRDKRIEELEHCIKILKNSLWLKSNECAKTHDDLDSMIEMCTEYVGK